ncbi:MAG: hypothetical protein AAGB03_02745 [Pseudomonadota bacterium]
MTADNSIQITDETLRDGSQSLWGMMMSHHMIEPVLGEIAEAGFDCVDMPFHVGMPAVFTRFFQEDPRINIKMMRDKVGDTKSDIMFANLGTQVAITGQSENKTIVRMVYEQFKEWMPQLSEMMLISCTQDELQRTYPILFPMWRKIGVEPIPYLSIGHSERHNEDYYASYTKEVVEKYKPKRVVIKDVDGLLTPERVRRLVPAMQKAAGDTPLELHAHGMNGLQTYNAVVCMELGVRRFTTCIPPLANGSSHINIFDMVKNAEKMGLSHTIDLDKCRIVHERLRKIGQGFGHPVDNHHLPFDLQCYEHQIPGGVISNTTTQLAQLGIPEKLPEVLEEIPRILEDLGHPIMITPFSQFIVTQAVLNIQLGRWEECLDSCIEFAAGIYGVEDAGVNNMDQNIKDKLLSLPAAKGIVKRAEGLIDYLNSEPSEAEVKKQYGLSPDDTRENFVLKFLLNGFEELNKCTPGGPDTYKKYL